jgi:hypothetical protein
MFAVTGFQEVKVFHESTKFSFPSFYAYYDPIEGGAGSVGDQLAKLPVDVRRAVRNDVWLDIRSPAAGAPIEESAKVVLRSR